MGMGLFVVAIWAAGALPFIPYVYMFWCQLIKKIKAVEKNIKTWLIIAVLLYTVVCNYNNQPCLQALGVFIIIITKTPTTSCWKTSRMVYFQKFCKEIAGYILRLFSCPVWRELCGNSVVNCFFMCAISSFPSGETVKPGSHQ